AFGPVTVEVEQLKANYNVAPTQQSIVITNRDPHQIQLFEWGLVPPWSKDAKNIGRMINARAETILIKPSFRKPIREQRCLVIADSFYEWKTAGKSKQPYRIYAPEQKVLVFAGIWEVWRDPSNSELEKRTFSIVTTVPNAEMTPVHDRMPVVLAKAEQQAWLEDLSDVEITALTQTPRDGILEMYAVEHLVGKVRNNGPQLHEPKQQGLFG
ncbi:MAG: SOS response-associated peptidase, partial [Saprospiraceae bacterium]